MLPKNPQLFNDNLEVSLKSTTALPIHNHALIPTGLLLTVPDELLLAVLQVASPSKTLAVRVGTPLLTEPPIMSALVNLTMLYRRLGCLLLTVLVTIITDRPVLTVNQVRIVAPHVLQIKEKVILTCVVFSLTIVGTFPVLSTVVRVSIVAH